MPHLFLLALQVDDIAAHHALNREDHAPERQDFINAGGSIGAVAGIIAEIDKAVTGADSVVNGIVHGGQAVRIAMNGGNGPDAPWGANTCKSGIARSLLHGGNGIKEGTGLWIIPGEFPESYKGYIKIRRIESVNWRKEKAPA